jgi:hypothetical protein
VELNTGETSARVRRRAARRNLKHEGRMNYDQARELQKDGKGTGLWHYTSMNDGVIWAIGFCANDCPGHDTKEGAEEHYRQYLVSCIEIRGPKQEEWPKEKCDVAGCKEEATHLGIVRGHRGSLDKQLCETHATAETMDSLIKRQTWSVHS